MNGTLNGLRVLALFTGFCCAINEIVRGFAADDAAANVDVLDLLPNRATDAS